ncbi:MAG: tRNA pseudouridine(55) synthase TruB [Bacilli bacterium]|nr:tRNA pseudouridine(55) synthase TruB [Bacilli bacterium]
MMNGILVVNKEKDLTSRDVVNKLCHIFNTKKVGHTGTLDPIATGVLVVVLGSSLKIVDYITSLDKEYIAKVKLGINTDTLDITGNVLEEKEVNITNEDIDKVLKEFPQDYDMEVPIYSAIKVNGKKLYEYARNNIPVELPHHIVKIYSLERISDIKDNSFYIKCHVSKGTYIRSLIRDICKNLNTVGVMEELQRTKQGKFTIEESYTLDDIEKGNYKLLNMIDVLDLPKVEIDNLELLKKVTNGNKLTNIYNYPEFIFTYNNEVIAIYKEENDIVKPVKVFNSSIESLIKAN